MSVSRAREIVGVDFGAPRRARDQRRKILAIAAQATGARAYRVDVTGVNERLLASDPPGWSATELLDELLVRPARVVAFDFPFSLPGALLADVTFASSAGALNGAFTSWSTFSEFVAQRLPLTDPLDFSAFEAWRDPTQRARLWTKRATDLEAGGQPPLKDKFQATFQMTLLGNALLSRLWASGRYRVPPFPGGDGAGEVIEVYPGATLRHLGLASYKSRPAEAVQRGLDACTAAGVTLDVDPRLLERCCRYSSGGKTPDHDAADAFVALCTGILYAEGACRPALPPGSDRALTAREGAIWVPASLASASEAGHLRREAVRVSTSMDKKPRVFTMSFASVYPLYVQKAEKKGRTKAEVDDIIAWLTGYRGARLQRAIDSGIDFETFFAQAPRLNPNAHLITGVVCGVRVEDVTDPLMQKIRSLDKLIDELARGKKLESILRT